MRRCPRRRVLAAGSAALSSALAGCVTDPTHDRARTDGGSDVRLVAHRGCAAQYPENTIAAARRAAPHVDMVEIDVQRCGSGELVVFHDETLERVTAATGAVATTDWATLSELTVLDSGEGIPRLDAFLDQLPADVGVNVELKDDGIAADAVAATASVTNDVLISSFSAQALRTAREHAPEAAVAYIAESTPDVACSIASDVGCVALHPRASLVLETDLVSRAHDAGLAVNAWTVVDARTASALVERGVDGLIVDRWDIL